MTRRSFLMLMRDADVKVAVMAEPVEGDPRGVLTPEGTRAYLCVPGDRGEVSARLEEAVGEWLVNTPPMRQSAAGLARHLMRTLEDDGG